MHHVRPFYRSAENSKENILTGKNPWRRVLYSYVVGLNFISAIYLRKDFNTNVFPYGFSKMALFESSENFLQDIIANYLVANNVEVVHLLKLMSLAKIYMELIYNL